jgi:hypothetical protein
LKNAVFLIEGLDAAMSLVEMAIVFHRGALLNTATPAWRNAEQALLRRKELFNATRLRSRSQHSRIQNVINLVSCILYC